MAAYLKYKADGDPQPEDPQLDAVRALDNSGLAHLMKGVDLENAGQTEQAMKTEVETILKEAVPKMAPKFFDLNRAPMAGSQQPAKQPA